jgi:P-type Ca2+ transporter type 2C
MLVAVQEGRTIYADIRKSLHYLLSTNLSEVNVALAATALGMGAAADSRSAALDQPDDGRPARARVALEDAESDVMSQPPRDPDHRS